MILGGPPAAAYLPLVDLLAATLFKIGLMYVIVSFLFLQLNKCYSESESDESTRLFQGTMVMEGSH